MHQACPVWVPGRAVEVVKRAFALERLVLLGRGMGTEACCAVMGSRWLALCHSVLLCVAFCSCVPEAWGVIKKHIVAGCWSLSTL